MKHSLKAGKNVRPVPAEVRRALALAGFSADFINMTDLLSALIKGNLDQMSVGKRGIGERNCYCISRS